MARDMAKIVKITSIEDIPNKDRIKLISNSENAYKVIGSTDFKLNDLAVFVEADSILPDWQEFSFLKERCWNKRVNGILIKVMKMSGVVSWGILFTVKQLEKRLPRKIYAGMDVTKYLHIVKDEPTIDASPVKITGFKGFLKKYFKDIYNKFYNDIDVFPSRHIAKSDETTIQNCSDILEKFKNEPAYVTSKMEGMSITMLCDYKHNKLGKFYVCSRNQAFKKDNSNNWWKAAKELNFEKIIRNIYKDTGIPVIFQGELCGPGIQSNIYRLKENHVYIYKIMNDKTHQLLTWLEMKELATKYGFELVPEIIEEITLSELGSIDNLMDMVEKQIFIFDDDGKVVLNPKDFDTKNKILWREYFKHEGMVVRLYNEDVSFKVKGNDYKLWFK